MDISSRGQRFWGGVVILVLVTGIAGYVLYRYREHRIELLFLEASGYPPVFRNTEQSQLATKELGTYRGREVTQKLLAIATGDVGLAMPQTQKAAIEALAVRHDPEISSDIANLLQPNQSRSARETAVSALQKLPCNAECVAAILHYLERVWQGELNFEERTISFGQTAESVKAEDGKEEEPIYEQLVTVLQREHGTTMEILERVYGLGTVAPSKFALMVVSRAGLQDACPLLTKDLKDIDGTEKWFVAPREELAAATQTLHCQP
jgi:hypothetical protein